MERGKEDGASEFGRMPRLAKGADTVPGLTWPTVTFRDKLTVDLGGDRGDLVLQHFGLGHTEGDIVAWPPQQKLLFAGDLVEAEAALCTGDAFPRDRAGHTLDAVEALGAGQLVGGRGAVSRGREAVDAAVEQTRPLMEVIDRGGRRRPAQRRDAEGRLPRRPHRPLRRPRPLADLRALTAARRAGGPGGRRRGEAGGRGGGTWDTARTFHRDRELFAQPSRDKGQSLFPPFVNVSQTRTEELLAQKITAEPLVEEDWGHEIVSITQDERSVTVRCACLDGEQAEIVADYAVAALGSTARALRDQLGVSFDGRSFEHKFLICDIRADIPGWATERRAAAIENLEVTEVTEVTMDFLVPRTFAGRPPRGEVPDPVPGIRADRVRELARYGILLLTGPEVGQELVRRTALAAIKSPLRLHAIADIDTTGTLTETLRPESTDVRVDCPDSHIAAVVDGADPRALEKALRNAIAAPGSEPARLLAESEIPPGPPRQRRSAPETAPREVVAAG